MDNFHLQITPVELSYQSKESMPVSCLVKKVAISTGHTLQKYQIKSTSQFASGKAYFKEGPTFSMNKEFEARNTKISLHFLVTKDRNISCIGSTELDVAVLSNQPSSMIEIGLNNCNDPKARLKIQIQRKQSSKRQLIKQIVKPQPMTLLNTQGQIRQQNLSSRRGSANIPNAYQISRKNYKQAEIVRQQRRNQSKKSNSSKGSYKSKHNIATHNSFVRMNKASNIEEGTLKRQSPMPRKKTPQPIKFQNIPKKQGQQPKQYNNYQRFSISQRNTITNNQKAAQSNSFKGVNQHIQEPQKLKVKPYQQKKSQNNQNINSNISFRSLQDEKNHKYKVITQKLQIIHDKIAHSKEKNRVNTEQNICNNSEYSYSSIQNPQSCFQKSYVSEAQSSSNDKKSVASGVQSFNPYVDSKNIMDGNRQSPILGQCTASTQELIGAKQTQKIQKSQPIQKRFEDIANLIQLKQKVVDLVGKQSMLKSDEFKQQSSPSLKSPQHPEQQIQDIDIYRIQNQSIKRQLQDFKNQYYSIVKTISQKDKKIQNLQIELKSYKQLLNEKQTTLYKLNQSYQNHLQQIFHLKEKVQQLEKNNRVLKTISSKNQKIASLPDSLTQNSFNAQKNMEEQFLRARKKIVELQTQLKFRQNDNKCLLLEIDNIKRQRNTLQQEVGLIIKNDKNQLTRKASLARLQQMNSGSLAQHTRRQNEALKNEVKILQEKLLSLNSLFQSLIKNDDISKTTLRVIENQSIDLSNKCRLLQQKCQILQQQLKKKKNELAQIINIIWKHEDCQLMNDVFALITSNQAQASLN